MYSTATVRPDLMDAVREYAGNLEAQFIATSILPVFPTQEKAADFKKIAIGQATATTGSLLRAPGAGYDRVSHEITTDYFSCQEYGLEEPIDDGDKNDLSPEIDAEMESSELLTFKLLRRQEVRMATLLFNATTFSGYTSAVTTEWDAAATATPYEDIMDAKLTLLQNVGGVVDVPIDLTVSRKVYNNMVKTTNIKNLIGGGSGADRSRPDPQPSEIATICGLGRINIGVAQNNAADIWDDEYALLSLRGEGGNLRSQVQLGRTFAWVKDAPGRFVVEVYREEPVRSNIVRVRQYVDEKVFTAAAGYLLSNITT